MKKNLAVILAGGSGSRMQHDIPKQFLELAGKPIIAHTIAKFEKHPKIDAIFIVTHTAFYEQTRGIIETYGFQKVRKILPGGHTRQVSSFNGIQAAADEYGMVLLHDAVRPLISGALIDELLDCLEKGNYAAVVPGIPPVDTIIRVSPEHRVVEIPERNLLRQVQTPQAFKLSLIKEAHLAARAQNIDNASDDATLVLTFTKAPIYQVAGSPDNIKITYAEDIRRAEEILDKEADSIPHSPTGP